MEQAHKRISELESAASDKVGDQREMTGRLQIERAIYLVFETQKRMFVLNDLGEIYRMVGETIQELIGDGFVCVSRLDEETQSMRIAGVYGLGSALEAWIHRLNVDPTKMSYALDEMTADELRAYRSGRLEKFEGGLYRLLLGKAPKQLCLLFEKRMKLDGIYTMGFIEQDIHLGGAIIFARKDITPLKEMIESLVHQAAVTIHRLKTEKALRASEERFATIFRSSPTAIAVSRFSDNALVDVNSAWENISGWSKKEAIGKTPLELGLWAKPSDREQMKRLVAEYGAVRGFEMQLNSRSGAIFNLLMSADLINLQGESCMLSMTQDITGRKREERYTQARLNLANLSYESRDMDTLIRLMLDETEALTGSQVGFFHFVDEDQNTISLQTWSTNTRNMLCATEGKNQHQPLAQAGVWAEGVRSGKPYVCNNYTGLTRRSGLPQGHTPLTRLISLPIKRNNLIVATIGVGNKPSDYDEHDLEMVKRLAEDAFDIILRKRAEEELKTSNSRYELVLEGAGSGIWDWDVPNKRVHYSSRWKASRGYAADEISDSETEWSSGIHPEDAPRVTAAIHEHFAGRAEIFEEEYRVRCKDGSYIWILDRGKAIRDTDGQVVRMAGSEIDITKRKQAEAALRESEERYRGLMESLNSAISTIDFDGRFLYMNDMAAEKLGGKPQELIGRNIKELFPESIASFQLAAIQNVFQSDREAVFESISGGKGDFRWYRFALQPLHNEMGQTTRILVNATDIHDLKTAQQDLQDLNRTLEQKVAQRTAEVQDLYDNAPTGYHSLDVSGNFVMINQTELNWLGYAREEVIGRAARDFLTKTGREAFRENFPIFLERGWLKDLELEFIRKDGSILPVSLNATAVRDESGNLMISRSTLFDITERKKAECALRESEEQNRLLFEESPIPITLLDETGRFIRANRAYEQLAGISRSALYGKTSEEIGLIDSQVVHSLEKAMLESLSGGGNFTVMEHPLTSVDGTRRIVESHTFLLPINSVTHILVTTNDISAHKKAEEALRQANLELERAMRMKDEFLATMSHELRTPLTGILGLSEALQMGIYGGLSDKQRQMVGNVENSGRHLLALINDVLDLSKVEAGKLELEICRCSLEDICRASLQLTRSMAHQKRQQVSYSAAGIPILLDADARRIKQVLINLFSNAIKFTPENGEWGLIVEPDQENQQVRLIVWDKGIGIAPENLPKLFQPFTQIDGSLAREYSGTGLGLALVRRLVELHLGSVAVESSLGEGSRFIVTLPWTQPSGLSAERDDQKAQPVDVLLPLVLIADDNQILLDMLADFLETKNYRTAKAQNGNELLEKIESTRPDAILMDIQMPGLDGLEVIRSVRKHANTVIASTPIIAVTAFAMTGDRELCMEAGANSYIGKPVKLRELLETLNQLTGGRA